MKRRRLAPQETAQGLDQATSESAQRFEAFLQYAPVVTFMRDAAGRYIYVNGAFERLRGMPAPEVLRRTVWDLWPTELAQKLHANDGVVLLTGRPAEFIEETELPNGLRQTWLATNFPFETRSGERQVGCVSTDITERRRAANELRFAKEAAEAANRVKNEFLGNMSHEIRTPMNGIIGMTELTLDTELTSEQREYLSIVKASADSLLNIVNDIFDFSSIDMGKLALCVTEFKLSQALLRTIESLVPKARQKDLDLHADLPSSLPEIVSGDPGRLRQILAHLIGNAIKFTDNGQVLATFRAESVEKDAFFLHVAIKDTGGGIPQEKQEAIFTAFVQADGSLTRKFGGAGLGLAISKHLVHMMGGRIWVESEPGKGSTFHFTVRLGISPQHEVKLPVRRTISDLEGLSVLIVDGSPACRHDLEKTLTLCEMSATLAHSAAEAVKLLEGADGRQTRYSAILLDADLLDAGGFDLARRIAHAPHLQDSPIIMLTSAGQRGDAARCRAIGVAAYLTKPVTKPQLVAALLAALRTQRDSSSGLITRHSLS